MPPDPTVTAAFAMNPAATTVTVGASASFTNQSFADNRNITGYIWTVKRGSSGCPDGYVHQLNNVAFSDTGTWTVSLAVATDETGVSDTETVTITVNPSGAIRQSRPVSRSPSATTIDQGTTVAVHQHVNRLQYDQDGGQTWRWTSPGDTLVTSATTNNFTYQFGHGRDVRGQVDGQYGPPAFPTPSR